MKCHASALLLFLTAAMPAAQAQQAADNLNQTQRMGRQVMAQSCGICHLQPSKGSITYGPPLSKAAAAGNDEAMRAIIANGTERMPAFRYYLKPVEIDAIIAYVRTIPVPASAAANPSQREKSDD
jgi:mono/diheme cytochrome c family protein